MMPIADNQANPHETFYLLLYENLAVLHTNLSYRQKAELLVTTVKNQEVAIDELHAEIDKLHAAYRDRVDQLERILQSRTVAIDKMLSDTFKETMKIYGASGGLMGDTLADKMALRLGQFTKQATKLLFQDEKKRNKR